MFGNNKKVDQYVCDLSTNEILERTVESWLQKNQQEPFFLFVFYLDPHYDYIPPAPFDTIFDPNYAGSIDGRGIVKEPHRSVRPPQKDLDHMIALYDGEIRYTDLCISNLLKNFSKHNVLDETLVVVFGDHGDEFYERGSTGHAQSLYNELIHIPLLLKYPHAIPQNKQIDALVSQVDIMPTILDYLEIKYDGLMQGLSLRPLIEGQKEELHDLVYSEVSFYEDKVLAAAISKDVKFIFNLTTGRKQLFDLKNDANEQNNIYKKLSLQGPVLQEDKLNQYLTNNEKLANQIHDNNDLQDIKLDDVQLRQLKSLGYIQ